MPSTTCACRRTWDSIACAGTFQLAGGWVSSKIDADAYTLTNARGHLDMTDQRAVIDVERAQYAGGTISAHYALPQYAEPYPMSVDLRYNGISIEKLFRDWNVPSGGPGGAATRRLIYHWNKDKLLQGAGTGNAVVSTAGQASSRRPGGGDAAGSAGGTAALRGGAGDY